MKRNIYNDLIEWKNSNVKKPLMILGVRQCGKTYVINEFCKNEYTNYKYVNLFEDKDIIDLYNSELNSDEKYNRFKLLINFDFDIDNCILFIDEIQECEALIAELKYFCEKHNNVNIICAGSLLGVKLKRLSYSFPVGKVKMINMYPMTFDEFLIANNEKGLLNLIKECYDKNKTMGNALHNKALGYFRIYLITGGMPESVLNMIMNNNEYVKYDNRILDDILSSYVKDMKKHVNNYSESLKIERVYKSLPSQLMNASKKFQYNIIGEGAKKRDFENPLDWLEASNLVLRCNCVKLPEIPLKGYIDSDTFKYYLSDVGILSNMLGLLTKDIVMDKLGLYKGVFIKNYVACELISHGLDLFYWKSDGIAEVDFLIYNEDGIIPIEVKSSENTKSKSLITYVNKFNPKYSIRISTKDFVYNKESKIKSIPLYATFLIK